MKYLKLTTLLACAAIATAGPVIAKVKAVPTATATFSGETVAVGIGFTWGKGVLTFKGKTYPFKVDGLSAVGVGITKLTGTGKIYNLKSVSDFTGVYASAGGGASIGPKGVSSASLRNDKGVEIEFHAKERGISLNLDVSGVRIAMEP
jgi:hypothetical protein